VLHDQHRIRRWRIGREPGLRALTRAALLGFYRNFYHPGTTVLSIVGDIDPDTALAQVRRQYEHLPAGSPARSPGPTEEGIAGFRYREWSGDIGQTQLAFGWRTPETTHRDTPALDLLATVLGGGRASRLYRAVRERRFASSIAAYNYTPTELGVFVVHAESQPPTTVDAARAAWDQLRAVREGAIGDLEIERARRIFESRWVRRLEDMEGQANYLAEWEALGDWRLGARYLERLLASSRDDVVAMANRYLTADNAAVIVYRPASSNPVVASEDEMRDLLHSEPRPAALSPPEPYLAKPSATATLAKPEREEAGVRIYRTQRGIPILVRLKPGAPILHAGVFFLGGAREEDRALAGVTTLTVRTAVKGTATRTALQIAEEGEMLGGSVTGSVGAETFGWSISVPTRFAAAAIDLLADVTQHPTMQNDALETERAVAIADVIALRDDMFRYPTRLAMESAFAGHAYGVPATGTEDSLSRIDADAVRRWHAERVMSAQAVIVLVGDGDPDAFASLAAGAFGELEPRDVSTLPPVVWPNEVVTAAESRERAQSALTMLFPGPARRDPARYSAAMIASVASGLGGRFFDELREKRSLCYTVHAFNVERQLTGTFGAYIATSPDQEEAAREGLLAEFRRFREELITEDELERAQTYAIGVYAIRQQTGGAVLMDVIEAWLLGELRGLEEFNERIRRVTRESVQEVARTYFDDSRRVEGIVRGGQQPAR